MFTHGDLEMIHLNGTHNLEYLELQRASSLTETTFEFLKKLRHLIIRYCKIEKPLNISSLKNLHTLNVLSLNRGIHFLDLNGLTHLSHLTLKWNRIDILQADLLLSNLNQLVYLDLSHNEITEIRANTFANLVNLKHLNLSSNHINILIEGSFLGLNHLKELRLDWNQIKVIPARYFSNLHNLKSLDLRCNPLEMSVGHIFVGLFQLEILKISSTAQNGLNSLVFDGLTSLKTLELLGSNVKSIEPITIFGKNLVHLDLSNNSIELTNEEMFSGLKNLTNFQLNSNGLKNIEENIFRRLERLEVLSLENNGLCQLRANSFNGLVKLRELILNRNKLKDFDVESLVIGKLICLRRIDIQNNHEMENVAIIKGKLRLLNIEVLEHL